MSDEPTRLGWWIMQRMAAHDPPLNQAELARLADVSQSTISRWIFRKNQPRSRKLDVIARVLGADPEEVRALAGYGSTANLATLAVRRTSIASEIDELMSDDSPLPPAERELVGALLDRVIAPYRQALKTSRTGD